MMKNRLLILFLPLLLSVVPAAAKGLSAEKRKEISQMLTRILDREVAGCKTNVTQVVDAGNRDALRLDRHVLLSLPRAERGGDLRLDPQPAARLARPVGACRS